MLVANRTHNSPLGCGGSGAERAKLLQIFGAHVCQDGTCSVLTHQLNLLQLRAAELTRLSRTFLLLWDKSMHPGNYREAAGMHQVPAPFDVVPIPRVLLSEVREQDRIQQAFLQPFK